MIRAVTWFFQVPKFVISGLVGTPIYTKDLHQVLYTWIWYCASFMSRIDFSIAKWNLVTFKTNIHIFSWPHTEVKSWHVFFYKFFSFLFGRRAMIVVELRLIFSIWKKIAHFFVRLWWFSSFFLQIQKLLQFRKLGGHLVFFLDIYVWIAANW